MPHGIPARRTWFSENLVDADDDGWLEFSVGDEVNNVALEAADSISVQLRWEGEWGRQGTDLDLFLYDSDDNVVDSSRTVKQVRWPAVSLFPYEHIVYEIPTDGVYSLSHMARSGPSLIGSSWWSGEVLSRSNTTHYQAASGTRRKRQPGLLAVGGAYWGNTTPLSYTAAEVPLPTAG